MVEVTQSCVNHTWWMTARLEQLLILTKVDFFEVRRQPLLLRLRKETYQLALRHTRRSRQTPLSFIVRWAAAPIYEQPRVGKTEYCRFVVFDVFHNKERCDDEAFCRQRRVWLKKRRVRNDRHRQLL